MLELPLCTHYTSGRCRSCSLIEMPYSEQLTLKTAAARALADEYQAEYRAPVASPQLFESRNKAKMALFGRPGHPELGMVDAQLGTHPLDDCPLHAPQLNQLLICVRDEIAQMRLVPYDIRRRTGEIKYVIARLAPSTGQMLLRIVTRSHEPLEALRLLTARLQRRVPALRVVSMNIQPIPAAVTEGDEEIVLSKERWIEERMSGVTLLSPPKSFSQVNSAVAEKLYAYAADAIEEMGGSTLLDLFCGAGAFSLVAASRVKNSTGIELSPEAIEAAQKSAHQAGLSHATYHAADCLKWLQTNTEIFDTWLLNPPRRGLGPQIAELIQSKAPKIVIYSSCNPKSLAKDLKALKETHTPKWIKAFDMFPLTNHLEVLVGMQVRGG